MRGSILNYDTIYISFIIAIIQLIVLFRRVEPNFFADKNLFWVLPFFLWALITSFWSNNSFYSFSRAIYTLVLVYSLYFGIKKLVESEEFTIYKILVLINYSVLISCFVSLILKYPENAWIGTSANGFKGFFLHQNVLGAIIALTSFGTLYKFSKSNGRMKLLYIVIIITNTIFLLFTYSRGAYLLFGIPIIFISLMKLNKRARVVFVILAIIFLMILTNKFFFSSFYDFISKGYDSIFATRIGTYKYSLEGARQGNWFGLGYGISYFTNNIDSYLISDNILGVRIREKSSSILAIVEETGIIGLFIFLIPIIRASYILYYNIRYKSCNIKGNFIFKWIIFFSLFTYAQIEAIWIGVASFRFSFFFLFLFLVLNNTISFRGNKYE